MRDDAHQNVSPTLSQWLQRSADFALSKSNAALFANAQTFAGLDGTMLRSRLNNLSKRNSFDRRELCPQWHCSLGINPLRDRFMKLKVASPPRSSCGMKTFVCTALMALALPSAQAALFVTNPNNAGSTYGSVDSIVGIGAAFINGNSNTFNLETLNPGLIWSNFGLTVYDVTASDIQDTTVGASINGTPGTFASFATTAPLPAGLAGLGALFNVYTFSFANLALGGASAVQVALSGFNNSTPVPIFNPTGADLGGAVLTATAVPEPATYALLFAGLAAVGWVARRRAPGRA